MTPSKGFANLPLIWKEQKWKGFHRLLEIYLATFALISGRLTKSKIRENGQSNPVIIDYPSVMSWCLLNPEKVGGCGFCFVGGRCLRPLACNSMLLLSKVSVLIMTHCPALWCTPGWEHVSRYSQPANLLAKYETPRGAQPLPLILQGAGIPDWRAGGSARWRTGSAVSYSCRRNRYDCTGSCSVQETSSTYCGG